ncbi:DinB family protein [Chelatococcus reniformis]|uniref:Damage-inducible protein DinB n=1 Tax=Chelatococcus reniformis TaxID=1494448 RepID=A0A916URB2_9HYPH|nr:DinB family protein [Chelatococcus reniformis]GGC84054.1 damage-inducible protein DinB [Chelatococcus reniformis]
MPTDAVLPYRAMAYNNRWANHRLSAACAKLSPAELTAPRTGFFPSLAATLAHILMVDHFYVGALEGGRPDPAARAEPLPFETLAALREAQMNVDHRLIAAVESLDARGLERIVELRRPTGVQRERTDRLLLHLFQHQDHHRGQAHAMLSGTSVPPPQLDEFFLAEEVALRASEFAELGWTEDRVWGPPSHRGA